MKDVAKGRDRSIPVMQFTVIRIFSHVRWQRAIGTKESKQMHKQPGHSIRTRQVELLDTRRGKSQKRVLRETYRILRRRIRMANARPFRMAALHQAYRPVKIKRVRLFGQRLDQMICRLPICAGHRIIFPRCCVRLMVSVNEFNETYLAKNCSSKPPNKKTPVPSKAASSKVTVISSPRANVMGPGAATRRTTGADRTESNPSICRAVWRSVASV